MRIAEELAEHPLFVTLPYDEVARLAEHAHRVVFAEGARLISEGEPAEKFWFIHRGRVALVLHVPGRGEVRLETLGPGDILGWSWLIPPHRWRFGAVAVHETEAIEVTGTPVRELCERDSALGYALARALAGTLADRLQAARLRLLDLYQAPVRS